MFKGQENIEDWDLVIKAKSSLFSLNLKAVWSYRDLLFLMVKRDIISFYKQTILGPIWFLIQPLITTFMFVFVFGNLAKISTDGLPQVLFYLTGIVAWNYFSECLIKTSSTFKDNAPIFGKVYFPRLVMPLSLIFSNLLRFGIQFALLIVVLAYFTFSKDFHFVFTWTLLLIPVFIILMAFLALGFGMIISALTTKYRDFAFLITFGVQLWMYVTPIIYPISAAPGKYHFWISLNPMSTVIEGFRFALLGKGQLDLISILYVFIFTLIIFLLGLLIFNKVEKNFMDTV
ncbi:MAG: ABC transporter permease [Flavobacteriia bacterium]|jgi:lipopolysaccharide transport system permease protein